jgi:hypothetical protein
MLAFQKQTWPKWKSICYVDSFLYVVNIHSSVSQIEGQIARLQNAGIITAEGWVNDSNQMARAFGYKYEYHLASRPYVHRCIAELTNAEGNTHFVVLKYYDPATQLESMLEYDPYPGSHIKYPIIKSIRVFNAKEY